MGKTVQEAERSADLRETRRLKATAKGKRIEKTLSVCPVCLTRIGADVVRRGDEYFLDKRCDRHGPFSTVIWRGAAPAFETWGTYDAPEGGYTPDCPAGCGLCPGHRQKTCCALVEVTKRCDLHCPVCFADGGPLQGGSPETRQTAPLDGAGAGLEAGVGELKEIFKKLADGGNTFIQLSGGEPTMRDDLPEIISAAREAGCETVQLNTNGTRLGVDPTYAKTLKEAGLNIVFMQFDGVDDEVYKKLRGEALFDTKCSAIRACAENLLGVALVPTIVPGINSDSIGAIIDFGLKRSPDVRGVHFQPISYFGRYPAPPSDNDRITLPEILRAIEDQTEKKFVVSDFSPSSCDHPRCGFHGDFVVLPKMNILKIRKTRRNTDADDCCCDDPYIKNRKFVARRWTRTETEPEPADHAIDADYNDMDTFLRRVKSHGFTISAMAFQDAYNLDIQRLRRCSLHVADEKRITPFCAKYLTAAGV